MANSFFNASGVPGQGAAGVSAVIRAEIAAIAAGFDKMPSLGGNANQVLTINAGATGVTASSIMTLSGSLATIAGSLTVTGNTVLGDAGADTLTIASNAVTWSGSPTHSGNHTFSGTVAAGALSPASLTVSGATALNGGVTLGDASGDALTLNSSAVSIPNGLNFDSNTFFIDAINNRVAIGTGTATRNLTVLGASNVIDVRSSSVTSQIEFTPTGGAQWRIGAGEVATNDFGIRDVTSGFTRLAIDASGNGTPGAPNTQTWGSTGLRWSNVFSVLGNFSGAITSSVTGTGLVQNTSSASGNAWYINNSNAAAGAYSAITLETLAGGGDPHILYAMGATLWAVGGDNSDGDAFVISAGSAPGVANVFRASTTGAISLPAGDFDVTRNAGGSFVISLASNTSNTANSSALVRSSVAGTSAGDAYYSALINGGSEWTWGADNSDSDAFVVAASGTLGTSNTLRISTAGAVTIPGTLGVTGAIAASGGVVGALTGNASTATALATGRTISITGDLAYTSPSFDGSGNVTAAGTLATVNANVGSFGSSTAIPTFTVNGKGLITAAGTAAVVAPAGTLTGATLAAGVTASSLTSVGTLAGLTMGGTLAFDANNTRAVGSSGVRASNVFSVLGDFSGMITASGGITGNVTGNVSGSSGSTTGNAATATTLQTARNINGTSFNGSADITVTAAAGSLTGAALNNSVTASSLTSVGTLTSLTVSGSATFNGGMTLGDAAADTITHTGTPAGQTLGSFYTPTLTAVANCSALTAQEVQYVRMGSVVVGCGEFVMTVTSAAAVTTQVGISLPIPSDFTTAQQANGVVTRELGNNNATGRIFADTTNDRMTLEFISNTAGAGMNFSFYFSYRIN